MENLAKDNEDVPTLMMGIDGTDNPCRYVGINRNGGKPDQQAALLDINNNRQAYIDSIAAQLVELYLKAHPGLDKSINLNDMIRMSQGGRSPGYLREFCAYSDGHQ